MAIHSKVGIYHGNLVGGLLNRVRKNMGYLTQEDIEVLTYMANKGAYPDKKAILIDTDTDYSF